ncbi:MAG: hypothetical protein QME77_11650 [bacterium]|nr:hypothetical protein [bacterium]
MGQQVTGSTVTEMARIVQNRLDPPADIHASADYRRHVAGVLAGRAALQAAERTRERR